MDTQHDQRDEITLHITVALTLVHSFIAFVCAFAVGFVSLSVYLITFSILFGICSKRKVTVRTQKDLNLNIALLCRMLNTNATIMFILILLGGMVNTITCSLIVQSIIMGFYIKGKIIRYGGKYVNGPEKS